MNIKKSAHKSRFTSLELFAGAGGLALGVHAAGFKHLGLIENNHFAADTLRENCASLLDLSPDLIIEESAEKVNYESYKSVDLLTGGPPCQPFSTGGSSKGHEDERNLFPTFIDAVSTIMPKAILIENVKGLYRSNFREYFDYLLLRLKYPLLNGEKEETWQDHFKRLRDVKENYFNDDECYEVDFQLLDTADFGIPQRRERIIISAFRRDLSIEPVKLKPTHSKEALLIEQWITGEYWESRNIEPHDYLTKRDKGVLEKLKLSLPKLNYLKPWMTVRDAIFDLPEPVLRGEQENFSNHVQIPGARVYPCHVGSFYDYPAKALKAGTHGTPGGENCVLSPPDYKVRYFTTREAARLQTFPDKWHFHGSWGACIKQLGNAVPVELIRQFAIEIYERLALREGARREINYETDSRHHTTSTYSTSLR